MSHRMSYVRYLKEVGAPVLTRVNNLDTIHAQIRELEVRYEALETELQTRVDKLWTAEKRAHAWSAWGRAGCPTQWVEPRKVGMDPAQEGGHGPGPRGSIWGGAVMKYPSWTS